MVKGILQRRAGFRVRVRVSVQIRVQARVRLRFVTFSASNFCSARPIESRASASAASRLLRASSLAFFLSASNLCTKLGVGLEFGVALGLVVGVQSTRQRAPAFRARRGGVTIRVQCRFRVRGWGEGWVRCRG